MLRPADLALRGNLRSDLQLLLLRTLLSLLCSHERPGSSFSSEVWTPAGLLDLSALGHFCLAFCEVALKPPCWSCVIRPSGPHG